MSPLQHKCGVSVIIRDNRYTEPPQQRRYFVSKPQYQLIKDNQAICATHRILGHEACRRCKTLNYAKWHACHTIPVEGSQRKMSEQEWKR